MDKLLLVLIGLLLVFAALFIFAYYQKPALDKKKVQFKEDFNQYYNNHSVEHMGNQNKGVLKLFYVDWCGHCKNFKPIFEGELSDAVKEQQLPCKLELVNCEERPEEAKKYNIRGYPTVIFENEKNDVVEYQGERTANSIIKFIKNILTTN
jgi:thioredoxin-like negative regulator of GroEL